MELQLCLGTMIAHFRLYLVVLVLGSFRCLCARSAGGTILRSDWQSRWIEFVDGVSGDLAGFILHDSAPEQGLMRCLARSRGRSAGCIWGRVARDDCTEVVGRHVLAAGMSFVCVGVARTARADTENKEIL